MGYQVGSHSAFPFARCSMDALRCQWPSAAWPNRGDDEHVRTNRQRPGARLTKPRLHDRNVERGYPLIGPRCCARPPRLARWRSGLCISCFCLRS
jgi:hypothetical protein